MNNSDLIYGIHAVEAALEGDAKIIELWVEQTRKDKRVEPILELAALKGVECKRVTSQLLKDTLPDARHQGVVLRLASVQVKSESDLNHLLDSLNEPPFILLLDGVTDPHNLGACIRTAEAAGVHAIVVPKDKSCGMTATVRKVASGAAELLPFVQVTNLSRCLKALQERGIWIIGTDLDTQTNLYQQDLKGPLAIVMGAEAKGLRRLTKENCDSLVKLPMNGSVESLNVSVATGVVLFEALRQRL